MATTTPEDVGPGAPDDTAPDWSNTRAGVGDRVFLGISRAAAFTILVALAGVGVFLFVEGFDAFSLEPEAYAEGGGASTFLGYVGPLVFGTALAAVVALVIAVPLAIGIALFISHYAPKRLAGPIAYVMDLLAAVPSVVYGLWGGSALAGALKPVIGWLGDNLNWIPFFSAEKVAVNGRTMLTAAIVLAVMILPIIAAICREVFTRTPRLHEEAALALGATRWETIRYAVFPYARSGIVSAVMLGLGRALGETMAVAMVLPSSFLVTLSLIGESSPRTIAANIASNYKESTPQMQSLLIATGLVLFAFTFAVNFLARWIAGRSERRLAR
ncbi:phosphate ABC transporter permease subunit PstC [Nocardioides sp. R-C-SC26]|uniref:phosphate ABC transporter permease subunit PstC n=1 Tax=Nocardioides sp. R-C-SC26 TaxID=2870414 RepID=UPI001E55F7DA|nr:phosphate ABC transporter permease subunit PstC [Nocardioides sp. R-C-SC26]